MTYTTRCLVPYFLKSHSRIGLALHKVSVDGASSHQVLYTNRLVISWIVPEYKLGNQPTL